jgi:cellulose synthase/poly-beta-1,6-N-acetylglucosamine synthase-like glycosyltransferase
MALVVFCLLLTLGYAFLMLAYRLGWEREQVFSLSEADDFTPSVFISVIVPARNEEDNIQACLKSLLAQQYPQDLFEIIVVDDHSEDKTAEIVDTYADKNVRCIRMAQIQTSGVKSHKKAALAAGIAQSKGALIVTTDADCEVPEQWLLHIAAIYEKEDPVMIAAPVIYNADSSMLHLFQQTDFMSMQGITVAAHNLRLGNMSNGANLAFSKAAFEQVNGYAGVDHLASGDDYLLMMKLARSFPGRVAYLKSPAAIVSTLPQPHWRGFLQQRIRWASKSGKYDDRRLTGILLLVYLFNLAFPVALIAGIFDHRYFSLAAIMFMVKILVEYIFLFPVARFFSKRNVLIWFPFLQPLHIAYIVVAGFLGFRGSYEWKGRRVG